MLDSVSKAAISQARAATQRALDALDIVQPLSRAGLSARETKNYSMLRALRAMAFATSLTDGKRFQEEAGLEREASDAIAKRLGRADFGDSWFVPAEVLERQFDTRALSTIPGSKGGYLVGAQTASVVDYLRMRSVAFRLGAERLSGLTSNIPIPRQTGKATATWQGAEGTNVNASDQALGQLSLAPKTVVAITDTSEQLLKQTGDTAEAFIARDLGLSIGEAVDGGAVNGTGAAQPLGIKNTPGVTTGQDAASATLAKLLAFVSAAGAANAIGASPGWVTNTAGAVVLAGREKFSGNGDALWTGSPTDGQVTGYRAASSEQLASGNLIFGSWDSMLIADWGVLELAVSRADTRFNQAQVGIRAMWMVDVLVRYPQAFVVSTNLS